MKNSIQKLLKITVLCAAILFGSSNVNAQCAGKTISTSFTDGSFLGDVNITATLTGFTGAQVSWKKNGNPIGGYATTLSNMTAGTYCAYVYDSMNPNCNTNSCITVTDVGTAYNCATHAPNFTFYKYDSCGQNDIYINANSTVGSGNYSYIWNTGSTQQYITQATTGTYSLTITDNIYNCSTTKSITVFDSTCNPCNAFNPYLYENDPCGLNDVSLLAYPNSGSRYTYLWASGSTNQSSGVLANGTYSVTVHDNVLNCTKVVSKSIVDDTCNPCVGFYGIIQKNDGCNSNDVTLYAITNRSNCKYLWNTGATTKDIYNQTSGNYNVIITDSVLGCVDSVFFISIDSTCNPCTSFNALINKDADGCGLNDVKLNAYPQDSMSSNYTYLWNNGSTNKTINNQTSGSYWVKVTNTTTGCIDTAFITVVDNTCDPCIAFKNSVSIYKMNDGCQTSDMNIGAADAYFVGSGFYSYKWLIDSSMIDSGSVLFSRTTGTYTLMTMDLISGCKDTVTYYFVDSTCNPCSSFGGYFNTKDSCAANDIRISAYYYGGSFNFSYLWSTGDTINALYNKGTGMYKVTVTDMTYGCVRVDSIYVYDSLYKCCQAYMYHFDSFPFTSFYGDANGAQPISYSWTFGNGNTSNQQYANQTFAAGGNYTPCLVITDANNCKDTVCSNIITPAPGMNLKVSHFGIPYIKDTDRYLYITYQNIGTTTENAIIEYKYPAGMTLTYSNLAPLMNIGNKITFNVGSLAPGAFGTLYLQMHTPSSFVLGSIKCDTVVILPIAGDIQTFNNVSYECDSVVSSWDPNDKIANPKGTGEAGNIDPATKEINYLIRFQNEGNYPTSKVRVEDEIDPSFDINTLMIGDVSHNYRLVKSGNKLTWYFDISLMPKAQDEAKSIGYIQYTLKLKAGLSLGTQIKNTAFIYFDKNPAIVTNTTKNTLKSSSAVAQASQENLDFEINRTANGLELTSDKKMNAIRIYDMNGRLVLDKAPKAMKAELEINSDAKAIYIIHVDMGESTVIKKFQF